MATLLDFAFNVAHAYFSGDLLEPIAKAAGRELERYVTRAIVDDSRGFSVSQRPLKRWDLYSEVWPAAQTIQRYNSTQCNDWLIPD